MKKPRRQMTSLADLYENIVLYGVTMRHAGRAEGRADEATLNGQTEAGRLFFGQAARHESHATDIQLAIQRFLKGPR